MIVKRKLYSVMDEEGNLGYCLYNESTGEEKLFSVVEEEKMYARGKGAAVYYAEQMMKNKGNKIANKTANREYFINKGREVFERGNRSRFKMNGDRKLSTIIPGSKRIDPETHSLNDIYLIKGKSIGVRNRRSSTPGVIHSIDMKGLHNSSGNTGYNKEIMEFWKTKN